MSGNKCEFYGCFKTKRNYKELTFHRFPKQIDIAREWILKSGNIALDTLSPKSLNRKFVCSEHFDSSMYMNEQERKKLKPMALPNAYCIDDKIKSLTKNEETKKENASFVKRKLTFDKHDVSEKLSTYEDNIIEFSDVNPVENIYSAAGTFIVTPEKLNLLTPKRTYENSNNIPFSNLCSPYSVASKTSPSVQNWVQKLTELPSPQIKIKSKKKCTNVNKLLNTIKLQKALLAKKRSIINRLKEQNSKRLLKKNKKSIMNFIQETPFQSQNSKALVTMQILHKRRKPWSIAEKKVAFSIFYKSPSTYKYLRKNNIILPGERTIQRWLNGINYSPGFTPEYLSQIKNKVSIMSEQQKKCIILLDEIAIMKCLEYNKTLDLVEGFQDLRSFGRSSVLSKHALVIMIRGLYQNWKFPFSYFLTGSGVKGDELVKIIKQCVYKLSNIGLLPVAIVCDQGTQNRKMYDLLGGSESKPTTKLNDIEIFLIYDVPHLLKSVRNNLLNSDIKIQNKLITFNDIKETYNIDRLSNTSRAMPKITSKHLQPNAWQKMSVKLAAQIFSKSVSAAINTCVQTGELKSKTAKDTAAFINQLNDTFDCLNSKNLHDKNPNRRPLSEINSYIFRILEKTRSIFLEAEKIDNKKKSTHLNSVKKNKPPCFTGFIWSINAIIGLFNSENSNWQNINTNKSKTFFLLTSRLNQDPLENMFSIIRQKNGYNKNPSARVFRSCFANICSFSLMKCSEHCNCEEDNDEYLTIDSLENCDFSSLDLTCSQTINLSENINFDEDEKKSIIDSSVSSAIVLETHSKDQLFKQPVTLETCSVFYFVGYLAKKCINKFNCSNCETILLNPNELLNDPNSLLLINKTYDWITSGGLCMPSSYLIDLCNICLNTYEEKWHIIESQNEVLNTLLNISLDKIKKKFSNFCYDDCKEHFYYIFRLLFITKIHKYCKEKNSQCEPCNSIKPVPKLRILQNQ